MDMLSAKTPLTFRKMMGRDRFEPILGGMGLFLLLSLTFTLPALWLDERSLDGENLWLKPIKFQVALAIYLLTLSLYARWVPVALMDGRRMRLFLKSVSAAALVEMLWIGGAAMFGVQSHYNPHPVLYGVYMLMGAFAILLTTASLVFGLAIWRDHNSALPAALRLSLALGLMQTFMLTVLVAGTLSALPGPLIGAPLTGESLPFMGWSREVGDLRSVHFLATHALHAVPLVGVIAHFALGARGAVGAVWLGAGLYAGLCVFAFVQAAMGLPLPL